MTVNDLPAGNAPAALAFPHFPAPWQAVLWRNWGMVPCARLAAALDCQTADLEEAGRELGLGPDESRCSLWCERGYQTIIRQNWHLLDYRQILILLDWTPDKLDFILREDDFLWHKMGNHKPQVTPPRFRPLTAAERQRTAQLREWHRQARATLPPATPEPPFAFLQRSYNRPAATQPAARAGLRLIYSYSAPYGDPLLEPELDPYPDSQLADYAAAGVTAIWMQAVLYALVPWFGDTPYSQGWQTRLDNLRRLAQKMRRHGLKLMLYLNEPRGMPAEFFRTCQPAWKGARARHADMYALCTSQPALLDQLGAGVEQLFRAVPELGGFFCITMSENLTHCWSKSSFPQSPTTCPRCASQTPASTVAAVIRAMAAGAWRANPDADVIAWNWAWQAPWDEEIVANLPTGVKLMMVSETALETRCCGDIRGEVIDYSISKPGPGPYFRRLAACARGQGVPVIAKVQLNNTWENSAVPYIPVPGLVEEHLDRLRALDVNDFMVSWTLGGFPGGNLPLLDSGREPLYRQRFGAEAAPLILQACRRFEEGFRLFPFNGTSQIYTAPQTFGPASLLFAEPTGYHATMIGFPYDDLAGWTGDGFYPPDPFAQAFAEISHHWEEGVRMLAQAEPLVPAEAREAFRDLASVAETSAAHFRSTWLQISFVLRRQEGNREELRRLVGAEEQQALRLLRLMRADSRIGFEATNHYYYTENALIEKVFNCRHLLQQWS